MANERDLADRSADVELSAPELLARGYLPYQRYHLQLKGAGGPPVEQQRDVIGAGKVVTVLPVDVARDEVVLIRQFRLSGHLANGHGDLIETVAGRVEGGEQPMQTATRECLEEIGVAPERLVELFTYLSTPGISDEEITVFLAAVDAARVPARTASGGEQIEILRVPVDAALLALTQGKRHDGPLLIVLQWLALNRGRVAKLLESDVTY